MDERQVRWWTRYTKTSPNANGTDVNRSIYSAFSDALRSIEDPGLTEKTVPHLGECSADRCYYGQIKGERAMIPNGFKRACIRYVSINGEYSVLTYRMKKALFERWLHGTHESNPTARVRLYFH